jgi:hypothetical protein
MSEINLEKKYHERYVRWQDKTREQLSFFNNLLLTLSIGFLSFAYKNILNSDMQVCICYSKLSTTLLLISIASIGLSIFVGLMCVISRLYDFRITAHFNQVRYWVYKFTKQSFKDKSPTKFKRGKRFVLFFNVICNKYPKISIEESKKYDSNEEFKSKIDELFDELRSIAHNLGLGSWNKLKWQIGLFFIGILSFVIVQL